MSRISQNFFLAPNYLSNIKMLLYLLILSCVRTKKNNKQIQNLLMNSLYYCFDSCGDFYYVYVFRHPSYDFCTTLPNNKLNESYSKFEKVCTQYIIIQQEVQRVSDFSRVTAWQCYSNIRIVWMDAKYTQKFVKVTLSVLILHPK